MLQQQVMVLVRSMPGTGRSAAAEAPRAVAVSLKDTFRLHPLTALQYQEAALAQLDLVQALPGQATQGHKTQLVPQRTLNPCKLWPGLILGNRSASVSPAWGQKTRLV